MFNKGINELLQALPSLDGMPVEEVRRLLTRAWLEAEARHRLGGAARDTTETVEELRRLATALEAHLILVPGLDPQTTRAAAFVAAEALDVASGHADPAPLSALFGDHIRYERVETGLLYLIAGYDANAAVVARTATAVRMDLEEMSSSESWLLETVLAYLGLRTDTPTPAPGLAPGPQRLHERVREAIMRRLGAAVASHLRWLSYADQQGDNSLDDLASIIDLLESPGAMGSAAELHSDLHHLAILLHAAIAGTTDCALRTVPPPPDDQWRFRAFQAAQARTKPLLWPAAAEYARNNLPGPTGHAVVTVPTGAGKSAVADLAIAQALNEGWVLYLAPTNALVGQIRRQLDATFQGRFAAEILEFAGGMEFSAVEATELERIGGRQILVMTPEKCTLALRQNPEAFADLRLCVVDEAHLLGQSDTRALVIELAIAEILMRSPEIRMLLLSALIANPHDIAAWLTSATTAEAVVVNDPWRPTRTLRAVAAFEQTVLDERIKQARNQLAAMPTHRKNTKAAVPVTLIGGLQGAWTSTDSRDFFFVRTSIAPRLEFHRDKGLIKGGHLNRTAEAVAQSLANQGHHVLVFLPFNRQHCFSVAQTITGPRPDGTIGHLTDETRALLDLADAELGGVSLVRALLEKGVAVHTAAMLPEERRAAELAYEHRTATIMFATGTMAQGLNLPATAVVIGGTKVGGGQPDQSPRAQQRRRAELLNAIGRAGRATVAARSMAILIPDQLTRIPVSLRTTAIRPPFFDAEDASTEVESHLRGLLRHALDGVLDVRTLPADEQTALTILSHSSDSQAPGAVLRRTWAAVDPQIAPRIDQAIAALDNAATGYLHQQGTPAWVAAAAHRSGTGLPVAAALHHQLAHTLSGNEPPETIVEWSNLLLAILARLDLDLLQLALPRERFATTKLEAIHATEPTLRPPAWQAAQSTLHAWMTGASLMSIAEHSERNTPNGNLARTGNAPLPRTWTLVDNGFRHWMAMAAGGISAIITEGTTAEPEGPWNLNLQSQRTLALLPLGIRFGAARPSTIAWMRAGVHPRTVAHLLDELIPAPEDLGDDALYRWAWDRFRAIRQSHHPLGRTENEQRLIDALAAT